MDDTGKIYVADGYNHRIEVFNPSSEFLFKFGTFGSGDGQFSLPFGVTVDSTGKIYVADADNNCIQVFDSSGNFGFSFGTYGTGNGQFNRPFGVAVDSAGNIYVADSENNRIQVFDMGRNFLFKVGTLGTGNGQFDFPIGIALDSARNIYVVEQDNNRIQVFDSTGKFLFIIGYYGPGDGEFDLPLGVAVDSTGRIYVSDGYNFRVQVFSAPAAEIPEPKPEPYNFTGFYPPVDNPPAVNVVNAGSAVPVKFSLDDYYMDILLEVQLIECDSFDPIDIAEETVLDGPKLSYDESTDRYTYVWKTKKSWAGSCRQLLIKLDDGTEHISYFEFR